MFGNQRQINAISYKRSLYKEFENLNMNPEIIASKTDSKELYDKFLNAFWKTAIGDHSAGRWVIFGGNDIISKGWTDPIK